MSKDFYKGVFTASACIFLGSGAVAVYNYFSKPESTNVIPKCYSCGANACIKLRDKRCELYGKRGNSNVQIGGAVITGADIIDNELITVDVCKACHKMRFSDMDSKTYGKIYPELYENACAACSNVGKNYANVNIVDIGNVDVCKTCLDKYIEMDKAAIINNTRPVFVRNAGVPEIKYIVC